ncbi:MAG: GNAT family N-acetyltransferase [Spirochaetes bacterium]|nr:GNAT family N-acetyltransferase [Spirochaetota bacterium]
MEKLLYLSAEMKENLLDFLYIDESTNLYTIHFLENHPQGIGDIYLGTEENEISEMVHVKYDGNSHFIHFYAMDHPGLDKIAGLILKLKKKKYLLAGQTQEIEYITAKLNNMNQLNHYLYLQYNTELMQDFYAPRQVTLRQASDEADIPIIKEFLRAFFGTETGKASQNITHNQKIDEDMKKGIYLLQAGKEIIGMARFIRYSYHYIEISTVYIKEKYRNQGYGKILIQYMLKEARRLDKTPILHSELTNTKALKFYQQLGFQEYCQYTFQFI